MVLGAVEHRDPGAYEELGLELAGRVIAAVAGRTPDPAKAPEYVDRRRAVRAAELIEARMPTRLVSDPCGYFVVYPEHRTKRILLEHFTNAGVFTCVIGATTPAAIYAEIIARGLISRLDHCAYLGRELARAERSLETGEPYIQDRAAGERLTLPLRLSECAGRKLVRLPAPVIFFPAALKIAAKKR